MDNVIQRDVSSKRASTPTQEGGADIQQFDTFKNVCNNQETSPFFSALPSEIRNIIYGYVFADYEDLERQYAAKTCYRRPGYRGPRKTDTALLRTCQTVYLESWYLPWILARHTFFLAEGRRKPRKTTEVSDIQRVASMMKQLHPAQPASRTEVSHIQLFAQLYMLEPGKAFDKILAIPHFMPRHITLTLRHTDLWRWEDDAPIYIRTPWVKNCRFPASTISLCIEIECVERRSAQVDYVIERAQKEWFFTRKDDVHLVSSSPPVVRRWIGSSSWEGRRWIRDEDSKMPGKLQYYVRSISFEPVSRDDDPDGHETRARRRHHIPHNIMVTNEIASKSRIEGGTAFVNTALLRELDVGDHHTASEVLDKIFFTQ